MSRIIEYSFSCTIKEEFREFFSDFSSLGFYDKLDEYCMSGKPVGEFFRNEKVFIQLFDTMYKESIDFAWWTRQCNDFKYVKETGECYFSLSYNMHSHRELFEVLCELLDVIADDIQCLDYELEGLKRLEVQSLSWKDLMYRGW